MNSYILLSKISQVIDKNYCIGSCLEKMNKNNHEQNSMEQSCSLLLRKRTMYIYSLSTLQWCKASIIVTWKS